MAYQYDAINAQDEFRLMILKPGNGDDALCADIITVSFGDDVKYDAISYVWGPDIKSRQIDTLRGALPITESLASALQCLRSRDEDAVLWADAVCINQADSHEKEQQVRMIWDVYAGAKMVLVHLGEEREGSELVPALIEALARVDIAVRYNLTPRSTTMSTDLAMRMRADKECPLPPLEDPSWEAMRAIFRRPWFRRVWVIQEFTLADDVTFHCGSWEVPGRTIKDELWQFDPLFVHQCYHGANYSVDMAMDTRRGFLSLLSLLQLRINYMNGLRRRLVSLLCQNREALATRGRDHLFTMLGLAYDADDVAFNPDYDSPLVLVLCRYAAALTRLGCGRTVLAYACATPDRPGSFPSWIPDWTKGKLGSAMLSPESVDQAPIYSACGRTELHMSVSADETTLTMTGAFIDTIDSIGMSSEEDHRTPFFRSWQVLSDQLNEAEAMVSGISSCPSGECIRSALKRTLVSDRKEYDDRATTAFTDEYDRARKMVALRSEATTNPVGKIHWKLDQRGSEIINKEQGTPEVPCSSSVLTTPSTSAPWAVHTSPARRLEHTCKPQSEHHSIC